MNRKVWGSVGATVLVLVTVDLAAGAGHPKEAATVGLRSLARWWSRSSGVWDRLAGLMSWDLIGGVVVVTLVLALISLRRRPAGHREPWTRVVELARQGRSVSSIAQVTRQPQDAVRILLSPIAADRVPAGGKSFRSKEPDRSEAPDGGRVRRLR